VTFRPAHTISGSTSSISPGAPAWCGDKQAVRLENGIHTRQAADDFSDL